MDGPLADTVLNVKDHGAIGDGSADDTEAVRAAIGASREGGIRGNAVAA
jgi:polygalacturonase